MFPHPTAVVVVVSMGLTATFLLIAAEVGKFM
jgi:hypothetical protein